VQNNFQNLKSKKPMNWGIRLFVLTDSDTGYVHSIIPYYGKLTGDACIDELLVES
jgi:hypothetical protein